MSGGPRELVKLRPMFVCDVTHAVKAASFCQIIFIHLDVFSSGRNRCRSRAGKAEHEISLNSTGVPSSL